MEEGGNSRNTVQTDMTASASQITSAVGGIRKVEINDMAKRVGCLFLIQKLPAATPENCNQIGYQMFSGAVSCKHTHGGTASQECSRFPSKQSDTFSLYGTRAENLHTHRNSLGQQVSGRPVSGLLN